MAKVISNKKQMVRLVKLMEEHLDCAKGFRSKAAAQVKWQQFAKELNSLGPPERDWYKWQRVWIDLKCKIKKKKTTVGKLNNLHNLNETEEAVMRILDLNTCINPPGREVVLDDATLNVDSSENEIGYKDNEVELIEGGDLQKPEKNTQKEKLRDERIPLLESDSSTHEEFYESMINLMGEIKRSLRNIEYYTKKNLQTIQEQKDEILKIKSEKFEFYKQHMKRQGQRGKVKIVYRKLALKTET